MLLLLLLSAFDKDFEEGDGDDEDAVNLAGGMRAGEAAEGFVSLILLLTGGHELAPGSVPRKTGIRNRRSF